VLGAIDGRVDDISRRVGSVAESLDAYGRAVEAYARATMETVSYSGLELRRIEEGIEALLASAGVPRSEPTDAGTIELRLALVALGRLRPPAKVLAVGDAGNEFALSAASLGYRVTTLAADSSQHENPHLERLAWSEERANAKPDSASEPFDAAFLVGVPTDRAVLTRVAELLATDGLLVIAAHQDADPKLDGWEIAERRIVARSDELTWLPAERLDNGAVGVVMIVASPAATG
jgi:hypothetical protein